MGKKNNILRKIRPLSVSAKILISLGETGKLYRVFSSKQKLIQKNIERLVKKGFLDKKGGYLKLTETGTVEFLKLELSQTSILPDGKCCLVVFDIPEILRGQRFLLRKFLEDICFIPIQKSVWISQFDMARQLSRIFTLIKMDKFVRVFTAIETRSGRSAT